MGFFSDLGLLGELADNTDLVHTRETDERKRRYIKCCVCGNETFTDLMCMQCNFDYRKKGMIFAFKMAEEEISAYKEEQQQNTVSEDKVHLLNEAKRITPKDKTLERVAFLDIDNELKYLHSCLMDIAMTKEYKICDVYEKEINIARVLDYHRLIFKLREWSSRVCFIFIAVYMDEAGYDIEGEKYTDIIRNFFLMSYREQAHILSRVFIRNSIVDGCRVYTYRALGAAIEYTNENRDKRYWKENQKAENGYEIVQEKMKLPGKVTLKRLKGKIYPEDLCPCGSGMRFNECCGRKV